MVLGDSRQERDPGILGSCSDLGASWLSRKSQSSTIACTEGPDTLSIKELTSSKTSPSLPLSLSLSLSLSPSLSLPLSLSLSLSLHTYVYIYIYCAHVNVRRCAYTYIYIYMYLYTYTHIYHGFWDLISKQEISGPAEELMTARTRRPAASVAAGPSRRTGATSTPET